MVWMFVHPSRVYDMSVCTQWATPIIYIVCNVLYTAVYIPSSPWRHTDDAYLKK